MDWRTAAARMLGFARAVAIADLLIALGAAFACLALNWLTVRQYGVALMWGGLAGMALAGGSLTGSAQLLGNPNYWYVQSVMPNTLRERWRNNLLDLHDSVDMTILLGVAGLVDLLLGLGLQTL